MPVSEAGILLQDLDKKKEPKGLPRRRQGRKRIVSTGVTYLARQTLALLRDAIDLDTARRAWETEPNYTSPHPPTTIEVMELRETARDMLLQRSTTPGAPPRNGSGP